MGAGSPSFIIETNGDPLWGVLDGCNQYFVGDFIDDRTWEIFCRGSRTMRVWSWDGQEYFSWSGSGYSIGDCYADDFDSTASWRSRATCPTATTSSSTSSTTARRRTTARCNKPRSEA